MMQETLTIKADASQWGAFRSALLGAGLIEQPVSNEYMVWRLSGSGINAILYTSGKLVMQGEGAAELAESLGFVSSPGGDGFVARIGVDEVGKGDYFGPLIVTACFVSPEDVGLLKSLGVADSKKLSDVKMLSIGEELEERLLYESIIISPSEYDELSKSLGNISVVLAHKHTEAVGRLVTRLDEKGIACENVVFDQFSKRKDRLVNEMKRAGLNLNITQFHGGESDLSVATASILARYTFLKEWERMEKEYGFTFPKGASNVIESAREFVKERGIEELKKVAKVSFKTTQKVLAFL